MTLPKYFGTVLDRNGNAIAGASVQIKITGTSTLAVLYQDDESTVIANPLTTTTLGEYSFKIDDGEYDIVTSISGVTDTATKVRIYPVQSAFGKSLMQAGDAAAAGILLGLGTLAYSSETDYLLAPNNLSELTNLSDARTNLGLAILASSANAADVTSGTLADARLSANVPLLNAENTFSLAQTITGPSTGPQLTLSGTTQGSLRIKKASDAGWQLYSTGVSSLAFFDDGAATTVATFANQALGLGVTPTAGNGLLQFASGTTKANGIALGTDVFFHRYTTGAVQFVTDKTFAAFKICDSTTGYGIQLYGSTGLNQIDAFGAVTLKIRNNGGDAIIIDTSQNVGIGGTPTSKLSAVGQVRFGGQIDENISNTVNGLSLKDNTQNIAFALGQTTGYSGGLVWNYDATPANASLLLYTFSNAVPINYSALHHVFAVGNVGIGTVPAAGNGVLQLADHTTKAGGIAFGTDTFLHRLSGYGSTISQAAAINGAYFGMFDTTNSLYRGYTGYGGNIFSGGIISDFGLMSAAALKFATNGGVVALAIDTSQNATFTGHSTVFGSIGAQTNLNIIGSNSGVGGGSVLTLNSTVTMQIGNASAIFGGAYDQTAVWYNVGSVGAKIYTGGVLALTIDASQNAAFAGTITGNGSGLTNLPAANLTGALPAISGASLTSLNASNISSGTLSTARTPAYTGDVTKPSGSGSTTIASGVVTLAKMANLATATFIGRTTAGTGVPEALTVAQAKTMLNLTGTNSGDQTISLTGDVTGSGAGSFAATIANSAVTLAKMANLAANSIIGNNTGSAAVPIALTQTQVKDMVSTILGVVTSGFVTRSSSVTTEQSIVGTVGRGTFTIPANSLALGSVIRIKFAGQFSATASTDATFKIYIGAASFTCTPITTVGTGGFICEADFVVSATGASGTLERAMSGGYKTSQYFNDSQASGTTLNTTIANAVDVIIQYAAVVSTLSFAARVVTVEVI